VLEHGVTLRYHDPRRFGAILWIAGTAEHHPLLRRLGPEPLEGTFDVDYLWKATRGRRAAIKLALMDNHLVVGVGNIYANESLFLAGIRPRLAAGRLSHARCDALVDAVRDVLARAIAVGGTTLRDFVGGNGAAGHFALSLNVYGRAGEPCYVCGTPLKGVRTGQRATVYCANCQR